MSKAHRRDGFQQRERAYFDDLVQRTGDTWWGNTSIAGVRRLERRARIMANDIPENASVLELGCGAGAITYRLLKLVPALNLVACDISPVALEAARRRCAPYSNCQFLEADILNLPLTGTFDVIVGNGILHHLPLDRAIEVLVDLLSPGGKIVFFEPNLFNPHVAIEKSCRPIGRLLGNTEDEMAFSRYHIAGLLRDAGFSAVQVTPIDFIHPKTPASLLPFVEWAGRWIEQIPILRELAGSLLITGGPPLRDGAHQQQVRLAEI